MSYNRLQVSWIALSSKILKWRLLYHEGQPAGMELPGQVKGKAYVVNNYQKGLFIYD